MALSALPVLASIVFTGATTAEETCCVDEDFAAAFLPYVSYSRDWPPSFPVVIEHPKLTLIGSANSGRGQQLEVAWKSELEVADLRQLVAELLLQADWQLVPQHEGARTQFQRGFIPYKIPEVVNNQQFCSDTNGALNMRAMEKTERNILTLSHFESHNNCKNMIAAVQLQAGLGLGLSGGVMLHLPILTLPETAVWPPYAGNRTSGGSDKAEATATVESSSSPSDFMNHFEKQMRAQGWAMDTNYHGSNSSGQLWQKREDGLNLVCHLSGVDTGKKVRLRMLVEAL